MLLGMRSIRSGIKPHRTRYIPAGATWSHPQANPTTQTFYIPIYQVRNCPDRMAIKYANALLIGSTASMRQRMATNGYEIEVCPYNVTDGIYFQDQRPYDYIWGFAGATVVGGNRTSIARGAEEGNDKNYVGSCGNMWHEMLWAELGIYFPAGQRPTGHTSDVLISDWAEVVSLINDSVTDGAAASFGTDHPSFCNVMRCGQRTEDMPTFTGAIPFNATAAQVQAAIEQLPFIRVNPPQADITVTGGPLPTAVTVSFSPGQYANQKVAPFTVKTNSLNTGSPVVTLTTDGSRAIGAPYNISAVSSVQTITTTGSPASGTFVLNFGGGIDRMLAIVGPGTTTGTSQSRVDRWRTICTNNGWVT